MDDFDLVFRNRNLGISGREMTFKTKNAISEIIFPDIELFNSRRETFEFKRSQLYIFAGCLTVVRMPIDEFEFIQKL